jgi:hypothetical protein
MILPRQEIHRFPLLPCFALSERIFRRMSVFSKTLWFKTAVELTTSSSFYGLLTKQGNPEKLQQTYYQAKLSKKEIELFQQEFRYIQDIPNI